MDERVELSIVFDPSVQDIFEKTASSLEKISKKEGFDKKEFLETLQGFSKAVHAALDTLQIVNRKVKHDAAATDNIAV